MCISISGGAGTLSEVAFAWQIGKPVAAMANSGGWSEKLAGKHIDHRYPDRPVAKLESIEDAKIWIESNL